MAVFLLTILFIGWLVVGTLGGADAVVGRFLCSYAQVDEGKVQESYKVRIPKLQSQTESVTKNAPK